MVKISIVTPSFNQAQYLERTILSVINQNYPNLEYIIIDGGSTDGSIDIIKKYEKYLTYWESKKDEGQYHAIQKGFTKCTGEIMAWLNSDDVYHSKALFTVAEIFTAFSEVKWLTSNASFIDEKDRVINSYNARRWSKMNIFKEDYVWIQQESTFWKRSLWNQIGSKFDFQYKFAADFELWVRFFQYEKLYTTEALLGNFRIRRSNQKTLEHMPSYMEEYHSIIKQIVLSEWDKKMLRRIKFYEAYILKIPFVKRFNIVKRNYSNAYDYAPLITFDRESYKYIYKLKE